MHYTALWKEKKTLLYSKLYNNVFTLQGNLYHYFLLFNFLLSLVIAFI